MSKKSKEARVLRPVRDIRVDRIGFVRELVNVYIDGPDGIKEKVKAALEDGDEAQGDFFVGSLSATTDNDVSVNGLLKLYEAGTIKRPQLIACLTASSTAVVKLGLSLKDLRRLVRSHPGTPRFNVTRRKDVQFKLEDAVTALHGAIVGDTARAAVAETLKAA
jgi:hypothetical protein